MHVVIIGAGPAGLTAAYELSNSGVTSTVLEKDEIVGGISRTVSYKGYHFDIGGHRFFTKVKAVDDWWHRILPDEFLLRSRSSRILYRGKYFHYPLRPFNALSGLGIWTSFMVFVSYLKAFVFPIENERTFEDWVSNRFGRRLYRIFFKTYTEKVWGIPCTSITAEWAAQRIKGLSLKEAVKNALIGNTAKSKSGVIKTLIDAFHYPKFGPGMMWERTRELVEAQGNNVHLGADVVALNWSPGRLDSVTYTSQDQPKDLSGSHFISTMPVRELVQKLNPPPPRDVLEAANALNYRDFLTVALIIDDENLFPDNWIYIHDDSVSVGRIQNFKNWSPFMVPDPSKTCLGLEYFCFEGDGLWTMSDDDLIALGTREIDKLGIADADRVSDGTVVRMPKAYPVYDETYAQHLEVVRSFLDQLGNLQLVGRNGMHKYNNQDHSMLTAMLASENILGAEHDLWSVNVEQEYHEELTTDEAERGGTISDLASTQPMVPELVPSAFDLATRKVFARIDKAAFASAIGTVSGLTLFLATAWLTFLGGTDAASKFNLLGQYFAGYDVSYIGAFIGFAYSFAWGFLFGWLFAYLHNLMLGMFVRFAVLKARKDTLSVLLDYI